MVAAASVLRVGRAEHDAERDRDRNDAEPVYLRVLMLRKAGRRLLSHTAVAPTPAGLPPRNLYLLRYGHVERQSENTVDVANVVCGARTGTARSGVVVHEALHHATE